MSIGRHLVIAPLFALLACATNDAAKSELFELKAEMRAIREENARLGRRLDRVELMDQLSRAQAPKKPAAVSASAAIEVPSLTVVKLKPRVDPAPRVDTRVAVVEPSSEILDELTAAAPAKPEGADEPLDSGMADQAFEEGLSALKTGNVSGGVEQLRRFAATQPKHPKADNALYFAGVGLIGLGEIEEAARAFEGLLQAYPAGDAVADGMLKLAECRLRQNQHGPAQLIFQKIVASYPGTPAATVAESKLGTLAQSARTGSP